MELLVGVCVCRFGCEGVGVQMCLTLVFGKLASNSTSIIGFRSVLSKWCPN